MPRPLKPQKVKEFKHRKTQSTYEVMLDRNNLEFFVSVNGAKLYAPTAAEAERIATEELNRQKDPEWQRVIIVDAPGYVPPGNGRHALTFHPDKPEVSLKFERFEVAEIEYFAPEFVTNPRRKKWVMRPLYSAAEEAEILAAPLRPRLECRTEADRRKLDRHTGFDQKDLDHSWRRESCVRIPYSEEAWATLCLIQERIIKARQQIFALLESDNLEQRLLQVGSSFKLLGSGQ